MEEVSFMQCYNYKIVDLPVYCCSTQVVPSSK